MRRTSLLFAVAALAACQKPETPEQASARIKAESDSARTAIEAAETRFAHYLNNGHPDSLSMLYTTDGVMMGPNAPAVMGRDSIHAYMARNAMSMGATLTLHTVDVAANGPIAIERGTFSFSTPAAGRTPAITSGGKYLVHWHKMGSEWLMAADIWNDDVPAMTMPAGSERR